MPVTVTLAKTEAAAAMERLRPSPRATASAGPGRMGGLLPSTSASHFLNLLIYIRFTECFLFGDALLA